jgi:hypothetical protein
MIAVPDYRYLGRVGVGAVGTRRELFMIDRHEMPPAHSAKVNHRGPVAFKRLLLVAWSVWLSVVLLSNLADAAKALGWLPGPWLFASGNWEFVRATTARYGTPDAVNAVMFAGVVIWEGIATFLFWRAAVTYHGRGVGRTDVYRAFAFSLLLWAGFFVADEVFIAYPLEATHMRLFVAQLLTLLAIELLPDE